MMKAIAVCPILMLIPWLLFAQRQTNGQSRNLVQFGSSSISIVNNFITDSGRTVSPEFIRYPFAEEAFAVTGPKLTISVINLDSGEYFKGAIHGILLDTTQEAKQLFSLPNLQVRINRNNEKRKHCGEMLFLSLFLTWIHR